MRTIAIAMAILVVLLSASKLWKFRPTPISQSFVRLIESSQMSEAAAMLVRPSEIAVANDQMAITTMDGSVLLLPPAGKVRFYQVPAESSRLARRIADFLSDRQHIQLGAAWVEVVSDTDRTDHIDQIYCTVIGPWVVIDHVGE